MANCCVTQRKGKTDINWGNADPDILFAIFNRLPSLVDLHRAKSVCWGWNKAATRYKVSSLPAEMPWLIFTPFEKSSYFGGSNQVDHDRYCRFLIMEERKFYPFNHRAVEKMDDGCCWCCCGSSRGWLVCLDEVAVPFLLNPFTSQIINLPPMGLSLLVTNVVGTGNECCLTESGETETMDRDDFVDKAALSSSPATNKYYYLVIIYGYRSRLGFFRGGDKSWSMLHSESYSDIIFHQNHLYALSRDADYVGVWDMHNQHHVRKITIQLEEINMTPSRKPTHAESFFLVELQGSLLVVQQFIKMLFEYSSVSGSESESDPYFSESESRLDKHLSLGFTVFKLDIEQKICREIKCLPKGIALFLGRNQSFSMEVTNSSVFKQDMIYFADDPPWMDRFDHEGHDPGVFALKDKRVRFGYIYGKKVENQKSTPTWLLPCISS